MMSLDRPNAVYSSTILEDKVEHNLIKINKLSSCGQRPKYIIKNIFDYGSHCKVEPLLVQQVNYRFRLFYEQNQYQLAKLDQVHCYMVEECFEMLQSKQIMCRSQLKKSMAYFKQLEMDPSPEMENDYIVLPQEEYYLQESFQQNRQLSRQQKNIFNSKMDISQFSLEQIPVFDHSHNNADLLWASIEKLYKQHRIDQAYLQCQKYQNVIFLSNPNSKLSQQKHDLIQQIHAEEEVLRDYYQYFNEPGYTFDKQEDGISMWYRINEEKKEVAIRIEAELSISIENFMCITTEVDLFSDYVPFAYNTKQIMQVGRNQKVGVTRVYVPILSNREAYFFAAAYDRLQSHNSVFFYSKTITSDANFLKRLNITIERDLELVELEYKFYILQYSPIAHNRGKVRLATNIDMKLNFLPLFIINKMIRIFSFDFIKNLIKVNAKFKGSPWEKKMQQRPDIYHFFRQRINDYLSTK